MQKLSFICFLFIICQGLCQANDVSPQPGDSLQILYQRVWAYEKPGDFNTRLGPYSYKWKCVFISEDDNYSEYYRVKTPDDKTAFIKKNLLADDKRYTRNQLAEDLRNGVRVKSQYPKFDHKKYIGKEAWKTWVALGIMMLLLYFFWKRFKKIEYYFFRKGAKNQRIFKPSKMISYSVIPGLIIGVSYSFLNLAETEWFIYEGFRLWTDYPKTIHWILWASVMFFAVNFIIHVMRPILKMRKSVGITYSILSAVVMTVYFFGAYLSGGVIAFFLVLFFMGGSTGSSGSSGSGSSGSGSNQVYDPSRSKRWNQLGRFQN